MIETTELISYILAVISGPIIEPIAEFIIKKIPNESPIKNLSIVGILNVVVIVILMLSLNVSLNIQQVLALAFLTGASSIGAHTYKKQDKKG